MTKRIGYIGLGLMGKPIARNLMKAGYPLVVHNRSQAAVEELIKEGAERADSPRAIAEASDVVFTNLPDTPDVEQVIFGENGIIEGCHKGMIYIDNSTIKPEAARNIATALTERGAHALDAPVSGGDVGAKAGTLAVMVGGSEDVFEEAKPIFEAIGKTITYVGESGAGQVAKACNQIMVAAQMVAMAELLLLAEKTGVNPEQVIEAIIKKSPKIDKKLRASYKTTVTTLNKQKAAANGKLKKANAAWRELAKGMDGAWKTLKTSVGKASKKFK